MYEVWSIFTIFGMGLLLWEIFYIFIIKKRSSDRGNGSHNVSLPMILKRIKVSQMLRSLCISLLLVPIL